MPSGRDADIFHDENLWSEKLLEGKGESSATADSVRSRLANVFIDEDGIPSGMGSFSEQRSADTSSARASETVIYSAPVFVLLRTQKTNISKGILGVAVLRSSTRTPEDELVLYTATKKVELRQKFHDSFCVLVSDQQVTFEDFFHNQWWLSFADFNTLLLFVVTVVRSVERQFGKRGLHVVRAGEGQEANVGDSVLFDMTKYTENSDGRLVELKRDVGMKMKITKKMTEPDQWQHVLVGMKRGCVRVIALPEFVICILLKKLKPAKGKSPEAREVDSNSTEMTTGAAEVNVKIATVADSEAGYEEGGDHGSSLCERMARIGQPLPVLSDTAVRHLSTANEGVSKTAEKDLSEETMPHSTAVEEKPDTKDRSSRTPFPAPRHHSSVRGNDISCGMSLEMFYQTFLLELDRLYNRMEMSYAHMVRDQIQSVKEEVHDLRNEMLESIGQMSSKIDEINGILINLSKSTADKHPLEFDSVQPSLAADSILARLMDRFAGEGTIEMADVRNMLCETFSVEHTSQC